MSDDTTAGVIIITIVLIFIGGLIASTVYIAKTAQECKTIAINKGLPTLEIMELCK